MDITKLLDELEGLTLFGVFDDELPRIHELYNMIDQDSLELEDACNIIVYLSYKKTILLWTEMFEKYILKLDGNQVKDIISVCILRSEEDILLYIVKNYIELLNENLISLMISKIARNNMIQLFDHISTIEHLQAQLYASILLHCGSEMYYLDFTTKKPEYQEDKKYMFYRCIDKIQSVESSSDIAIAFINCVKRRLTQKSDWLMCAKNNDYTAKIYELCCQHGYPYKLKYPVI